MRSRRERTRDRGSATWRDRGSATIEMAILTPAVMMIIVTVLLSGRYTMALQAMEATAYDVARSATLARTERAANAAAVDAAARSLAAQGLNCRSLKVVSNLRGFRVPVGQPATVTVTVTCMVEFKDLALPGVPGSTTLVSTFTSPLDTYRSRR